MLVAILLVYLLMAINFQSWLDPFIILMALPGALAGILWMLYADANHAQRTVFDGRDHGASAWPLPTLFCWSFSPTMSARTAKTQFEAAVPRASRGFGRFA